MSASKLNRNEPFADIFGDTEGRRFEQGGRFFRPDGSLWRDAKKKESAEEKAAREAQEQADAEAEAAAEAAAAAAAAAASTDVDAQLSQQLTTDSVGKVAE